MSIDTPQDTLTNVLRTHFRQIHASIESSLRDLLDKPDGEIEFQVMAIAAHPTIDEAVTVVIIMTEPEMKFVGDFHTDGIPPLDGAYLTRLDDYGSIIHNIEE